MFDFDPFLDTPLYGAVAIAEALNLKDEDGNPDERKAYHGLERGYYDASKVGRIWTSTRRRLLRQHLTTTA
jgi:hypothetical protein